MQAKQSTRQEAQSKKTKILLLGAGYANMSLLTRLDEKTLSKAQFSIITKEPYHYKSICLHDVASGKHDKSVLFNVDSTLDSKINVIQDEITSIESSIVKGAKSSYEYDYLVVGLGFGSDDFGIKGVREYAKSITSYSSAREIYALILSKLEGLREKDDDEAKLSFAVCGGGFSGIEFAGSLAEEVAKKCSEFGIDFGNIKIYCIEAAPKILPMFSDSLQRAGLDKLESLGVQVLTSSKILECKAHSIIIEKEATQSEIDADVIIWTAGVKGNPVIESSPLFSSTILARSRVEVDEFLRPKCLESTKPQEQNAQKSAEQSTDKVLQDSQEQNLAQSQNDTKIQSNQTSSQATTLEDISQDLSTQSSVLENVFVLGDCASFRNEPSERFFPPTAQLAREQGKYLAQVFQILLKKKTQKKLAQNKSPYGKKILPFRFTPKGSICSIGESYALGALGSFEIKGRLASVLKKIIESLWNLQLKGFSL